jgi:hypothetical protein
MASESAAMAPTPATNTTVDATPAKDSSTNLDACAFQCGICKQQYKRADHLARHVRSRMFPHVRFAHLYYHLTSKELGSSH